MKQSQDLLDVVAKAFICGLKSGPPRSETSSPLRLYAEELAASIGRQLPDEEWSCIRSCTLRQDEALQAAREGRIDEAVRISAEVSRRAQTLPLSHQGHLLMQVFLLPVDAYIQYRLQDFDRARDLVASASAIDETLATEFGFVMLSGHRLQLGLNLLRIDIRCGELSEALELGASLLDYLELRIDLDSDALVSARPLLDSVSVDFSRHYFDKICGELAILFAGRFDDVVASLFDRLVHHSEADECRRGGFGQQAHDWIRAKHLALSGEWAAFLKAASKSLQRGKMNHTSLWYATVVDVAQICRRFGPAGLQLADRMESKASVLDEVQPFLKLIDAQQREAAS